MSEGPMTHAALVAIGDEGGTEALALVAAAMDANAAHADAIRASLYEGMEADRDRWRERALAAERRIRAAEDRLLAIFDAPVAETYER